MGSLSLRGTSDPAMGLTDDEVTAVELCDPYTDTAWSGARLSELERRYRERARAWRDEAAARVCAELHRSNVEPWMTPLVERACEGDRRIALAERIADLAAAALRGNAILVFEGD